MDLIDELLERDAGTVNSTIIGKPLDSLLAHLKYCWVVPVGTSCIGNSQGNPEGVYHLSVLSISGTQR